MADFTIKTASEIRDDILRTIRYGLARAGVSNPNVAPGSDQYIFAQAVGDQLEVAMANGQVKADGQMEDTATGDDLVRALDLEGLSIREAAGAVGSVILTSTQPTAIAVGTELVDGSGLRFMVEVGGTYASGDRVPVRGIDTGAASNHAEGDILRWLSPPAFALTQATVGTGGLTGGVDQEDEETARQRLLDRKRNPPAAGNAGHVATLAEAADPLVQKAFVYPAVAGPASVGIAVVGYATDVSKSRTVPSLVVTSSVKPYVDGLYPEHVSTIVTSVTETAFDVTLALTLPSSPKASPPGPGGGWSDASPWPRNALNDVNFRCRVTAVASSSQFTVDAPSPPTAGTTTVAWLSPLTWLTHTATVQTVSGTPGAYAITLDKAFPNISAGCLISANALNVETYFDAILEHFAKLGPGEKLPSSSLLLARAYRHPTPATAWPCRVDAALLRALVDAGEEVQDAAFLYRTSASAPAAPASVTAPPGIFIPRHIAIYEAR